jgi:hypothetical protein
VKDGPVTFLTVPNVTVAGSYFLWDSFTVPSSASITGMRRPTIACSPGALYRQTDAAFDTHSDGALYTRNQWQCQSFNGFGIWNGYPHQVRRTQLPSAP